jgi:hypothetical protein
VDGEVALDDESPDPHPTRTAATIAPTTRRLDCRVPRRRDRCRDTATSLPERCDDATPTATLMTRVSHHQGTSARARGLQQVEDLGFLAPTGPLALFVSSGVFAVGLRSSCLVAHQASKSASTVSDHHEAEPLGIEAAACFQRRCVMASVIPTPDGRAVTSRFPRMPGHWGSGASPRCVRLRIDFLDGTTKKPSGQRQPRNRSVTRRSRRKGG